MKENIGSNEDFLWCWKTTAKAAFNQIPQTIPLFQTRHILVALCITVIERIKKVSQGERAGTYHWSTERKRSQGQAWTTTELMILGEWGREEDLKNELSNCHLSFDSHSVQEVGTKCSFCAWATLDQREFRLVLGYFWCYRKVSWISTLILSG